MWHASLALQSLTLSMSSSSTGPSGATKILNRCGLNFDEYAQWKFSLNEAKIKAECRQLWDSEGGKKWKYLDTWYCEVNLKDYVRPDKKKDIAQQTPPPPDPDAFQFQ